MKVDFDDLVQLLSMPQKHGDYYSASCPFHDNNSRNMLVFEDGWFQCLACTARGIHDKLYHKLQGMPVRYAPVEGKTHWRAPNFPDDHALLEEMAYECHNDILDREHLGWYWQMRGVAGRIEPCVLGWYSGWYSIPVFDVGGKLLRLILRAGKHIERHGGTSKYYNSPGPPILYVPDWKRYNESDTVFVVFGMIDALAIADVGYAVCTVTSGKEQFKPEWITKEPKKFVIVPDMGEHETAYKVARHLHARGDVLLLPYDEFEKCDDPASFLQHGYREELTKMLAGKL